MARADASAPPAPAASLRGLAGVEQADVYKAGRLAGRLSREGDDTAFSYVADYLADGQAPAVALTLPRGPSAVRATGGSVPPFFAGLLPEGARLQALTAGARTSADDQLTLLLVVGADAIGDVAVVPHGAQPHAPPPLLDAAAGQVEDFSALFARATSPDPQQLDRVALPGVQVKVSAAMMTTPLATTAGPAILKLDPPDYPHLVGNEAFFLTMAAGCGLSVCRHQLLRDGAGRAGLLVERFDRVPGPDGRPHRLAQEDACQVLGRYPAAKYRLSFQEAATALADAVEAGGGSRRLALRRLLEIAAFSYLIGNGDLHGKNLSIRQDLNGVWEVTPAYDLLTTQPYMRWSDPMALAMYGRANRLQRRWWLQAATQLGLPDRAVAGALDRILEGSRAWLDRLGDIGFDPPTTLRLRQLLAERHAELAA